MGLDMYLTRSTYVKNWDHMTDEEKTVMTISGSRTKHIKPERVSEIVESLAYWRKANHIHKWFVDNVQDGEDDCKEYYVSREQLTQLLDLCKRVDDDHTLAPELLPTQGGFFFGDTSYDECYFEDIKHTINVLEDILKEESDAGMWYQSSW